jgi:6-methylsalicylate decarboxylase
VIDVHQHLWPNAFITALAARSAPPYLRRNELTTSEGTFPIDLDDHRLDRRLALLDELGIDVAVVSLQPTLGLSALPPGEAGLLRAAYHAGALELARASKGRIVPLACGAARDGFAGACVGAPALLDPAALAPLADALVERGQLLFVHPGACESVPDAPDWWGASVGYTAQMQAAYAAWLAWGAERWPGLPVVFAILAGGAPIQNERLQSRGVDTRLATAANTYFDTASYGRLALELSLASYGVGRLLYGSDIPIIDPGPTLRAVNDLGKAASDALFARNASILLAR